MNKKIKRLKKFSAFLLPKTKFGVKRVAARLEHRRVEGKR